MMTCVLGGNPEQISLFNFFPNCRNGVTFEKIPSLPNRAWTLDWMTKSNVESWGTVAKCICIISFITVWIFEEMSFQARKLWLNFPHKSSLNMTTFRSILSQFAAMSSFLKTRKSLFAKILKERHYFASLKCERKSPFPLWCAEIWKHDKLEESS